MKLRAASAFVLFMIIITGSLSCGKTLYNYAKSIERGKAQLIEKTVQVDDHKIVYLEGGAGETILLVHGFGGDKDNWTRFARQFAGQYRIIAPDLPGFGESSRIESARYDIDTQTLRLKNFAKALDLDKFHIAGNSMGGWISANYAVKFPGDLLSLTLMNSAGLITSEKSEMMIMVENGFNPLLVSDVKDYDRLMKFVFVKPPYVPGALKRKFAEKAVQHRDFNDKIFADLLERSPLMEELLPSITAPSLIIWGDTDRVLHVSGAEIFDRGIKDSRIYILEKCGHLPMIERPEETAGVFLKFIAGDL